MGLNPITAREHRAMDIAIRETLDAREYSDAVEMLRLCVAAAAKASRIVHDEQKGGDAA